MNLISIHILLISLHFLLVESTEGDEEPVEFTLLEFNSKNDVFQEQIKKVLDIEKWEQKMSEKVESVKMGNQNNKNHPWFMTHHTKKFFLL